MAPNALAMRSRKGFIATWIEETRLSKARLARGVLVATGVFLSLVLAVWMLLLIGKPSKGLQAIAFRQGVEPTMPWVGSPALDAAALLGPRPAGGSSSPGGNGDSDTGRFLDQFARAIESTRGATAVVYVAAAGAGDVEVSGGYIPTRRATSVAPDLKDSLPETEVLVDDLINLCKRYPDKRKLVFWDAGQIGTDRNLGLYGNPFVRRLAEALNREAERPTPGGPAGLTILVSCAPGQTSWWSDADGRSVFGYFLERGLQGEAAPDGRTVVVGRLADYVRENVAAWVKEHRDAEQTPVLLGDRSASALNLRLPRTRKPPPLLGNTLKSAATVEKEKLAKEKEQEDKGVKGVRTQSEAERVLKRIETAWEKTEEAARPGLLHRDPKGWLTRQEAVRRAERFFRGGDLVQAEQLLDQLPSPGGVPDPTTPPLSIAELERRQDATKEKVRAARESIDNATAELIGSTGPAPAGPEAAPEAEPANADDPSKKVAAKADTPAKAEPKPPLLGAEVPGGLGGLKTTERARPPADVVFKSLVSPAAADQPLYLEGQLPVWARVFTHSRVDPVPGWGPDPSAFNGPRGDVLRQAVELRGAAETVVAADPRLTNWVRPLIDSGDAKRRLAQDRLFTADRRWRTADGLLKEAAADYLSAARVSEIVTQALALCDQALAFAPGFAEWLVRRPGSEPAPERPVIEMLGQVREVLQALREGPGTAPADLPARESDVQARSLALRQAFDGLERDYAEGVRNASRWRDIDALLCAPLAPAKAGAEVSAAKQRADLLRRVTDPGVSRPLTEFRTTPPDSSTTSSASVGLDDLLKTEEASVSRTAIGLARLEIAMLAATAPRGDASLDLLKAKVEETAARTLAAPDRAKALSEISRQLRTNRQLRLRNLNDHLNTTPAGLLDRDLAVRTLPLADLVHLNTSGGSPDPLVYIRQLWLVWQADRLLDDFAFSQARVVLGWAKGAATISQDVNKLVDERLARADRLARAPVRLDVAGGQDLSIAKDKDSLPIPMTLKGTDVLPVGEASVFLSVESGKPITLSEKREGGVADLRLGALAEVGPESVTREIPGWVARSEPTKTAATFPIRPGVFYRGQIFPRQSSPLSLAVAPQGGIEIELRQSDAKITKEYGDQFTRHRNQGFLHPGTNLACKMVISHNFTQETDVRVRHWFPDVMPEAVETVVKLRPNVANEEVLFKVDTAEHDLSDEKLKYYMVEIYRDKDSTRRTPVHKQRFPFRKVKVDEILVYDLTTWNPDTNTAIVGLRHLVSDPVNGPALNVRVFIGNQNHGEQDLKRGARQLWWESFNAPVPKIPITISMRSLNKVLPAELLTGPDAPPAGKPADGAAGAAPPAKPAAQ